MIERALWAIRPAASVLVDKNVEIGIPAGLVVLGMFFNIQYPPPHNPGRQCSRPRASLRHKRDDFSRTLSAEPAYAIFDPWGAAICGASPRMKRKGFIDDENEEVSA